MSEGGDAPLDTDGEDELGLGRYVEGLALLCGALSIDEVALCLAVFGVVALGAVEDDLSLLLVGLR
jgi:hypothetical protein